MIFGKTNFKGCKEILTRPLCMYRGSISASHLGEQDLMYENSQYGINKMFVNEEGV